jgi:uncharacterized membrane protein
MTTKKSVLWRSAILGFGLGGFFDGIVLHQVLQWHHLASSRIPMDTLAGLQLNTLLDGLFHLAAYAVTLVGVVLVWGAVRAKDSTAAPRILLSGVLIGFGVFHIVDSILLHWLLNLHHICYEPNLALCDGGYFVIGLVLIALGMWLQADVKRTHTPQQPPY